MEIRGQDDHKKFSIKNPNNYAIILKNTIS